MTPPDTPPTVTGSYPGHVAPSIAGWVSGSGWRHTISLLIAALVIAGAHVAGGRVDWRVYVVMASWIAANAWLARWALRPVTYERRLRRYAWTIVADVLFLAGTYFFLDAAQYMGAVFFAYMGLVAAATLSRRWAVSIAALIVVVYTGLLLLTVYGPRIVDSPISMPPVRGNVLFVVAGVASALGMVLLLMRIQRLLIKSIRDAELRYVTLVQSASDMVMTFDASGQFLDVNAAAVTQSGYTWEEIKSLPNASFFPAEDWPAVRSAFERTLAGESVRLTVRYLRKGGEERWLHTSAFPLALDGKPATVVIARDVTDAHRQHAELRERDERFAFVLDALGAGFVTFDRDLRVTSALGEWARTRASAGTATVGLSVYDLTAQRDLIDQHERAEERVLRGERVTIAWRAPHPAGERRMRTHLVPLRDAAGVVAGGAAFWVDETDLARAEEEREELRRRVADADRVDSLGKLVSGVAHELNNPLAAILNFTEDLLADARTPEERLGLEIIQAQALRSRTIVRDLLTYARRDVTRPRVPVAPVPVLDTVARAMRPGLASQGVHFAVDLAADVPAIPLDRTGFEQVVTNLITNAAHAAGSGGSVRLTSRLRSDAFEVSVEDNGPGVPPDVAAKIFEPFFTTKPTGHGVGLGLSVSLGIVHAHGGTLTVQNRAADVGGGARFTMRLPLSDASLAGPDGRHSGEHAVPMPRADAPRPPVSEPASQPRPMPERKRTILIIDDESAIRQGLRRYFTRKAWVVEESPDGADALARLLRPEAQRIYDVVLCDLKMAGVSGMDVYDRMRSAAPALADRFILSTGDTSAPDVSGFLSGVSVPVLEKPFELTALEDLAEQVRTQIATRGTDSVRGPA
ncbi:MAG: PAS domain-containing protein [Gemmatimonadota bacterium]|nr:PAS domain-containing protein [Gemmatimonadota bacterium]